MKYILGIHPRFSPRWRLLFLFLNFCASLASSQATVLLFDQFNDGNRGGPSADVASGSEVLSNSGWWDRSNNLAMSVNSNVLRINPAAVGGNAQILTYFTPSGSPVALAVGETLRLTMDFSFVGSTPNVSNGFSVGFFNSNGTRTSADNTGANGGNRIDDLGYAVRTNPGATTGTGITEKTSTTVDYFTSLPLIGTTMTTGAYSANTTYTMTWDLTLTSSTQMDFSLSINGGILSATTRSDTVSPTTSFDTLSFFNFNSTPVVVDLDNVKVEYFAVPEPHGIFLSALVFVGLVFFCKKYRRSKI
ncbi:MAG: hypothetical protein V4507_16350 [Verrucomicrobiota bacterium]